MIRYTVYAFFGEDDQPLYVGYTSTRFRRILDHLRQRTWADDIVTIKLEHFDEQFEALTREAELIRKLKPRYNVANNPAPVRDYAAQPQPLRARIEDLGPGWMRSTDAARELGLHHHALSQAIIRGSLKGVKVGSLWAVNRTEIERYQRENQRYTNKPGRYGR
jgi:excisionase family DNA binding protein